MTCRYVDADMRLCSEVAVYDLGWGRGHLPRCQKHRSASPAAARRHTSRRIFERARTRGLVSQTEMLHVAEADMDRALYGWRIGAGRNAGGQLDYWGEVEP